MTIAVVDRIANTTKSKTFTVVFSPLFELNRFDHQLLIGNFAGIFSELKLGRRLPITKPYPIYSIHLDISVLEREPTVRLHWRLPVVGGLTGSTLIRLVLIPADYSLFHPEPKALHD
jgi:hypothetical protein